MRRPRYLLYIVMMLLLVWKPMNVSADIGPKPSVKIEFVGLEEEEYYVTLLSEDKSTGPWSFGDEYYDYMGEEEVFHKFEEYVDPDGYYFLSYMENCSEDDTFGWGYYPPKRFKVLIYLPEQDRFIATNQIYERYAFDSYFTVKVSSEDVTELEVEKSYDYLKEIFCLLIRIVLTILVESLIAFLFYSSDKKAMKVIFALNVITQVILNVLLNIIDYQIGGFGFLIFYIQMEVVVFIIEAIAYTVIIGRKNLQTGKKYHPWIYAAVANFVSFNVGFYSSILSEIL